MFEPPGLSDLYISHKRMFKPPGPSGLYTRDRKRFQDPPGQTDSKLLKSVLLDRFQASGDMDMAMAVDAVIEESSAML